MPLVLCPGIHPDHFTVEFLTGIARSPQTCLIVPTSRLPVYSPQHVFEFLQASWTDPIAPHPVCFIAFSAGVVGALGAARNWHRQGGQVAAFLAFDGWGVPLHESFSVYRFSHDYFTDWTSGLLGQGDRHFYADPPMSHLDLWRSPQQTMGYLTGSRQRCSAADAVIEILGDHQI